jgi:hypothetical protein
MTDDDRDLHEIFAAVRREEEAHVPPISILSLTARGRRPRLLSARLATGAACLATAIAAAVWLLPGSRVAHVGPNRGREQATASIGSWKPATDFLLETPGRELLEGIPDVGQWPGVVNAPGPGKRPRLFKKQSLP